MFFVCLAKSHIRFWLLLFCVMGFVDVLAQNVETSDASETLDRQVWFQGMGSLGLNIEPRPILSPNVQMALGVRIKERGFVGGGVGFMISEMSQRYGEGNLRWSPFYSPLFFVRGDVYLRNDLKWTPYLTSSVGLQLNFAASNVYGKIGFGVEYRNAFVQLCYSPFVYLHRSNYPLGHSFSLDIGYRFNTQRYHHVVSQKEASLALDTVVVRREEEPDAAGEVHFQGVGYMGVYAMPLPLPSATLTMGVMKNDRYYFGGGVGLMFYINNYHDADPYDNSVYAMPLPVAYLQTDIYVKRKRKCVPYFSLSAGTCLPYAFYFKAGVGLDYKSFVWQLSYSPGLFFKAPDYVIHGVTFNFGYRFNTAKYNKRHKTSTK